MLRTLLLLLMMRNNNDNNDNNGGTMLPTVKPVAVAAMKTTDKKTKKADEIALLPTPKLPDIRIFSIEGEVPLTISNYATSKHDYANVVFHVNRTIEYGEYEVRVDKDGRLISFVHAIRAKSFDKTILKKLLVSTTTRAALASLHGTIRCRRWRGRRSTPKWTILGKVTGSAPEMEVHRNPSCHR
jgi:hypothetical protein